MSNKRYHWYGIWYTFNVVQGCHCNGYNQQHRLSRSNHLFHSWGIYDIFEFGKKRSTSNEEAINVGATDQASCSGTYSQIKWKIITSNIKRMIPLIINENGNKQTFDRSTINYAGSLSNLRGNIFTQPISNLRVSFLRHRRGCTLACAFFYFIINCRLLLQWWWENLTSSDSPDRFVCNDNLRPITFCQFSF